MITTHRLMMVTFMIIATGVYMAFELSAQTPRNEPFDYSNAASAEVRDPQGRVVLKGQFSLTDNDPNDSERRAMLSPTGVDAKAFGQAEVEMSGSGAQRRQEIEFEMRNLQPGGVFTLVIDGRNIATVTTNSRGAAEYEMHVPLP